MDKLLEKLESRNPTAIDLYAMFVLCHALNHILDAGDDCYAEGTAQDAALRLLKLSYKVRPSTADRSIADV